MPLASRESSVNNSQPAAAEIACELRGVTKRFLGARALDDVSLEVRCSEIHALLGENGAGKSTLVKIMTGVHTPDGGELWIAGEETRLADPHDARRKGVSCVSQDVLIIPTFSIGRNIILGREERLTSHKRLSASERDVVRKALSWVDAGFDENVKASALSVPEQRLAEVARALINPGDLLVFDEPTATLSEHDAEKLLDLLLSLRGAGKAIVYVTHRLSEVMRIADRITVLRDGRVVGSFLRGEIGKDEIVALMAKDDAPKPIGATRHEEPRTLGKRILEVKHLSAAGHFQEVSFTAREGEIIGIAGVQGSGHGHLLRAIACVAPVDSGSVRVEEEPLVTGRVRRAFEQGVLLVPADRRTAGIVGPLSVRANIALSSRVRRTVRRLGLRWQRGEREMASEYRIRLSIRRNVEALVGTLSGGNQQKVVLARAMESNVRVLLIEEPTQGIDVHTKAEIRLLLRDLARSGLCVVIASSEFEELPGLVDAIHVMCMGRVTATLPGAEATYSDILAHALP